MASTPASDAPITVFELLTEVRGRCERNGIVSLHEVHRDFDLAICNCRRPTAKSNPSFEFFGDWIARTVGIVKCHHGQWQQLSLDCWHIVSELYPDDREAYFHFWKLFECFCRLDERLVATFSSEDREMRCELRQLHPDDGIYARCYFRDDDRLLGERIVSFGCFDSADVAKRVVELEANVPFSKWLPATHQ